MAKKGKGSEQVAHDEKERVSKLKRLIDKAFEETSEQRKEMDRYMSEFGGEWWDKDQLTENESRSFANFLFSTVMSIAPLLTDNRPIWSVAARYEYMQRYMNTYALALEYNWDRLNMDSLLIEAIIDALVMKIGILKVYFTNKGSVGGDLKIEVIDPRTFFWAPGYTDIWEVPYCGEKKSRSLYWIRDRYPEKGRLVQPDEAEHNEDWNNRDEPETHDVEATVYEIWMRSSEMEEVIEEVTFQNEEGKKETKKEKKSRKKYPHGKIVVFAGNILLEEKPYVYDHDKPPYVTLYDYKVPHQFLGFGEGEQIEELNRSFNVALQRFDKYVRMFCDPNWLVDARAGLEPDKIKEEMPLGGNVWTYNSTMGDEPVKQIEVPAVNRSVIEFMSMLPKLIEEITGVTDVSKGMSVKAQRQSATEISTLLESSYTRTRQRVRNLEFAVKQLCYLMVCIMQQFYTDARSISRKKDDEVEWFTVTSDRKQVEELYMPKAPTSLREGGDLNPESPEHQKYLQDMADYKKMIEVFGEEDKVYADFDIIIQTNSTLPMDKQSLANMAIRLLERKAIDPQAVLEILNFPKKEEIIKRMESRAKAALQAKQGGNVAPPRAGPMGVMQQMNKLRRAQ